MLGRRCTEDSNCDTTKNIVCSKGKCVCDVNHFEKNYICVSGIDGNCKESEECHVNNSFCQNDRCKCAMNFYASKNKSLCIANAKCTLISFRLHVITIYFLHECRFWEMYISNFF